jgi:hypothetical protein
MWAWKFNIHTHEFEAVANNNLAGDYDAIYIILAANRKLYIACDGGEDIFRITESFAYPVEDRFGKEYVASNVAFSSEEFKPFNTPSTTHNIYNTMLVSAPNKPAVFTIIFPMKLPLFISKTRIDPVYKGVRDM